MKRFRNGQERQSGTIRRDPAGVRGRGDNQELGSEAWRSPAGGASGDCERDAARPEKGESGTAAVGTGQAIYRADAGGRASTVAKRMSRLMKTVGYSCHCTPAFFQPRMGG